jgi:hypothetical protein
MALSLEDMMATAFSLQETLTISVQNTLGQIAHVRVRPSDPTSLFPKQFADEVQFNPRMVHKFRFYLSSSLAMGGGEQEEEDRPLSQYRSIHFSGKTWREVLPSHPVGVGFMLHVVILNDAEEEEKEKLALLRTILLQRGCYESETMEDSVLWGCYLEWFLHAREVHSLNRYQTMVAFAEHFMDRLDGSSMEM